jgi:predicted nucleic acid-binding protein
MTTDEIISEVIRRLREDTHSQADVADAVKAISKSDPWQAFVVYNFCQLLIHTLNMDEAEVRSLMRQKLANDALFRSYFMSPYLASAAIGFELGKRAK